MLEQLFLKVIEMSRAAGIIIVVVVLVRMLLKQFPKYISYLLWSVVLFRLLCPFTLESGISPVPNLEPVFEEYRSGGTGALIGKMEASAVPGSGNTDKNVPESGQGTLGQILPAQGATEQGASGGIMSGQNTAEQGASEQITPAQFHAGANTKTAKAFRQERFLFFGKYVWLLGIGILLLYCTVSLVRIRRKVAASIPLKGNIYITDEGVSPFVMGIWNPKIYLPACLGGEEREYIILHEKFHIRRFDHVTKPLMFAALCVHWFNPLVWTAFVLFCRDMEMSCDEAVIKRMGEAVRADYSASLLALSTRRRIIRTIPVDFGEGDTKSRVKNLAAFRNTPKVIAAVLIVGVVILIVCLASTRRSGTLDAGQRKAEAGGEAENGILTVADREMQEKPKKLEVSVDITEHYITRKGDPSELYYIDENHVLWGCGRNEYGQLGQGTQDNDFHEDMVKIAENVVHVDFSQRGFVIFITEDHRLYGMGNAAGGALQQYTESDWSKYLNGERCYVSEPYLLAVNVAYACCGRDDIVCLKEDGTVWTWGTVYQGYFIARPQKIFESAVLVTGGWHHHAALLPNGTVWTWGYNEEGNCGVADLGLVGEPTMVAEDVVMVWTDIAVDGYLELDAENRAMAWMGKLKYTEYDSIAEYDGGYPQFLNNTVIQKADGSYWVCGEYVGSEEKAAHGREGDYPVICTHEFYPCE
ncbi:MAG: hypothetical protein NC409_00575 [Clostridium sp.]|nr:hypothetical protein [Clostridium sp.]